MTTLHLRVPVLEVLQGPSILLSFPASLRSLPLYPSSRRNPQLGGIQRVGANVDHKEHGRWRHLRLLLQRLRSTGALEGERHVPSADQYYDHR